MSLVLVGALAWKSVGMRKKRQQWKLERATQKLESSTLRSSEEVQRAFAQPDLSGFSEPSRFEATAQDPDDFAAPPLPARHPLRPEPIGPILPSTQYSARTPYDAGNAPTPSPYSNSTPYDSANNLVAPQDINQYDLGFCDLETSPSAPPPPYEIRDDLNLGYIPSTSTRLATTSQPQQSNNPARYLEYVPVTPTLSLHGEESWVASQVELVPAPLRVHSTASTEKSSLEDARDSLPSQWDSQSFRDSQGVWDGVWDGIERPSATMRTIPTFTMEMEDTSLEDFAASPRNSRMSVEERWEISKQAAVGRPGLVNPELQVSNVEWRPASSVYDEDLVGGAMVNGGERRMERKMSYDVGDDEIMLA